MCPPLYCPIFSHELVLIPWAATVSKFSGFVLFFVLFFFSFVLSFFFFFKDQMNLAEEKAFFPGTCKWDMGGAFIRLGGKISQREPARAVEPMLEMPRVQPETKRSL